jgi:hypothetical protein
MKIISECDPGGQITQLGQDKVVGDGPDGVLLRQADIKGRDVWQRWVPDILRPLCMRIHHEGSAHPGATRVLDTTKLRFYWPAMRQEITSHCQGCRGCALRNSYLRRPKVPIQEYPDVRVPMGRVHIDLTGELPETDGNKSKYIMVVKDFHTKFVWLFAIRTKDAVAVADQ